MRKITVVRLAVPILACILFLSPLVGAVSTIDPVNDVYRLRGVIDFSEGPDPDSLSWSKGDYCDPVDFTNVTAVDTNPEEWEQRGLGDWDVTVNVSMQGDFEAYLETDALCVVVVLIFLNGSRGSWDGNIFAILEGDTGNLTDIMMFGIMGILGEYEANVYFVNATTGVWLEDNLTVWMDETEIDFLLEADSWRWDSDYDPDTDWEINFMSLAIPGLAEMFEEWEEWEEDTRSITARGIEPAQHEYEITFYSDIDTWSENTWFSEITDEMQEEGDDGGGLLDMGGVVGDFFDLDWFWWIVAAAGAFTVLVCVTYGYRDYERWGWLLTTVGLLLVIL